MNPIRSQHEADQIQIRLVIWSALLIGFVMGFYVLPNFQQIFAEMLPVESLPWTTRIVMSAAGRAVFSVLLVLGAALLVLNDSRRWARWLHNLLINALALALGFTVMALFAPIMRLLEDACRPLA